MSEFSYQEMWALEEPMQKPHKIKADELGVSVTDVPVSPALTRYSESLRRITELFSVFEIEEEGISVEELLNHYTEMQIIDFLEEKGFEHAITLGEIEGLLFGNEWERMLQIPSIKGDFFLLKQFEESSNGRLVDISAYSTMDFLRTIEHFEFDKYRYFTDKVAERVKDIAIMHSCVSDEKGKENLRSKFVSLVNLKYRDYALKLIAMLRNTDESSKKSELMEKIRERNRQIRRLNAIWQKYAYWS